MESNEIHDEIRCTRDALVRECGTDARRLGDHCRAGEERWAAAGHPVVSFIAEPLRELPPGVPPYRGDGEDNEILREIRAVRADLARETGYDPKRLFDYVSERERESAARGVKFVSFAKDEHNEPTALVREEPPKP